MRLAPALTWMHLLPPDSALECRSAPEWFGRLIAATPTSGRSRRASVSFDADGATIIDNARNTESLIAVNAHGLSAAKLREAGFSYIRRFAAVPNLAQARWFIPLDSASVAAAGFALYTPSKFTARLKLAAVRLAARLPPRLWCRDAMWVAARRTPPLEQSISKLLDGLDHRLALSSGAPEPARNRKVSAVALGLDGSQAAFIKLPTSDLAHRLVRHEADVLAAMQHRFGEYASPAPRLLHSGDECGQYLLAQSPLGGRPAPARFTELHRRYLQSLQSPGDLRIATDTAFFKDLQSRIDALGERAGDLKSTFEKVRPTLAAAAVPHTLIHGDFAPWNLRVTSEGRMAAFDWEYGSLDGLPLLDETHFALQVGWLLHDWAPDRAAQELNAGAVARDGLSACVVRALQVTYLVDALTRLLGEEYDRDDDVIAWHRTVLTKITTEAA